MMENYTRYNEDVNQVTAERLLALNRRFYTEHARDFSATRARIQPGVQRLLGTLAGHESILDLGCGNGGLARELAERGHRGPYLGLDFSLPLLQQARPAGFAAEFVQADLASADWAAGLPSAGFDIIFALAMLHHIPDSARRLTLLKQIHDLLKPAGRFIHSNWQFLNSPKLTGRIQPWERAGLPASELDAGDYLLDWKGGAAGLRYVHHFAEPELSALAAAAGFRQNASFHSDGHGGRLSLYQIWDRIP